MLVRVDVRIICGSFFALVFVIIRVLVLARLQEAQVVEARDNASCYAIENPNKCDYDRNKGVERVFSVKKQECYENEEEAFSVLVA